MTDIEQEVAAFRDQINQLDIPSPGEIAEAADALCREIVGTDSASDVSDLLFRFASAHQDAPDYRDAVASTVIAQYALHIAFYADTSTMGGSDGHLARFQRLALACRLSNIKLHGGDR